MSTRSPLMAGLSILITLMIPVLLVLISVRLVMTETYLNLEYNKPDFPPDSYGFSLADRLYYAPFAVQYLLGSANISYLGNLKFATGETLYTQRELQHMVDVKNVFQAALGVLEILLVLLIVMLIVMLRRPDGHDAVRRGLFSGGLLTLVILVGLVLFVLINWDTFFTDFHDLFFAEGTWVFDYSDSLIRLFPIRFWQDAVLTIGGMSTVGAVLIMVGCWWWARRESSVSAYHYAP
ncbi:MAG: TIGR01906 family membrane protein [Chloroflexota bacterium]